MGEIRNAYKILIGKCEDSDVVGEDNIIMNIKEIG
jgi:hypothetical protein